MKIYREQSLTEFDFWSGAKDTVKYLSADDLQIIENYLESISDDWSETEINDYFWFDDDCIADILGYDDFEQLMKERKVGDRK